MADYDLGRAHGEIVIDVDDDTKNAERSLGRFRQATEKLQRQLRSVKGDLDRHEQALRNSKGAESAARSVDKFRGAQEKLAGSLRNARSEVDKHEQTFRRLGEQGRNVASKVGEAGEAMKRVGSHAKESTEKVYYLGKRVLELGQNAVVTTAKITHLDDAIDSLGQNSWQTAQRLFTLNRRFQDMRELASLGGILGRVKDNFLGISEATDNLNPHLKKFLHYNSLVSRTLLGSKWLGKMTKGLVSLGGAFALLNRHASRLGGVLLGPLHSALSASFPMYDRFNRSLNRGIGNTKTFAKGLEPMGRAFVKTFAGVAGMITGFGILKNQLLAVSGAAKMFFIGFAALSAASAGIGILGTAIMGVGNALKQLSGIAAGVPGVLLAIAAVGSTIFIAFKGIGDAFKAGMGDAAAFDEAIKNMGPAMQSIAKAVKANKDGYKELKRTVESVTLAGLGSEIDQISKQYLPVLNLGMSQVGGAVREVIAGFTDFAKRAQTQGQVANAFQKTADITSLFSREVEGLFAGMLNFATGSLDALHRLTTGMGGFGATFEKWAARVGSDGSIDRWILSSIRGFKQLGSAVKDISGGIKAIFVAFGGDGGGALERLAAGAERFRAALEGSANGGALQQFAEQMDRMSSTALDLIVKAFEKLGPVIERAAPLLEEMSEAFSGTMATFIGLIVKHLNTLVSVIDALNLAPVIGGIVALTLALKLFFLTGKPLHILIKGIAGALLLLRGAAIAASGAMGFMGAMGTATGRAANQTKIMTRVTNGLKTALGGVSIAGAAAVAAIALLVGGFLAWKAQGDAVNNASDAMREKADNAAEGVKNLSNAFEDNNGIMGEKVFEAVGQQLDVLKSDLENVASTGSGFMADIGASLKDAFNFSNFSFGKGEFTKMNEDLDNQANAAKNAARAIKDLGYSNEEMTNALASGDAEWQQTLDKLNAMGQWGRDAIAELTPLREQLQQTKESFAQMEPGSVALSNALKQIGAEGATSADKLDGLKSALGALGLIQQTSEEAAFEYSNAIREIADANEIVTNSAYGLGDAMFGAGGKLLTTNDNAYQLQQALSKLNDEFLNSAAEGNNVQAAYDEMTPALERLAEAYDVPIEKIREIIGQMGAIPTTIETIMSVVGSDEAYQEVVQTLLKVKQYGDGTTVPLKIDSQDAINALRAVGIEVDVIDAKNGLVEITADNAQAQAALDRLQAAKDKLGAPPGPNIPVTTPGAPGATLALDGTALAADKADNKDVDVPVAAPGALPVIGLLGDVGTEAGAADGTEATVPVKATGVPETLGSLGEVVTAAAEPMPEVKINPIITGDQDVISKLSSIQQACVDTGNQFADLNTKAGTAMDGVAIGVARMATNVANSFAGLAGSAFNSGAALGQGFADGISSKAQAVQDAALKLAEAASAPLPNSPAKIGPFSGKGWTPHRGTALSQGFAAGILRGAPATKEATMDLATIVANALDSISAQFGGPQMNFGANLPGATTRYYRDPEVTDDDLAKKRAEKAEEERKEARERQKEREKEAAREKYDAEKKLREDAENESSKTEDGKPNIATGTLSTAQGKASVGSGDIVTAIGKIAKQIDPSLQVTSGLREGDPGHHGTGNAADISNSTGNSDAQLAFANLLADNFRPFIKELIYDDPRFSGKQIKDGQFVDDSFYADAGDHTNHVHAAFDQAPTWVPGVTAKMEDVVRAQEATAEDLAAAPYGDAEQQKVAQAIIAEGKARGKSNEEIQGAISAGIVESGLRELNYGDRDSVGPFQQRSSWGSTEDRINAETSAKLFYDAFDKATGDTVAERVANTQRPQEDLRGRYAEEMDEAAKYMTAYADGTAAAYGKNADNFEDWYTADDPTPLTADMAEAVRIANDPMSSDTDVIQALNRIDQGIAAGDESQIDQLEEVKDGVLDMRGLKAYDPFEGATEDPLESGMSIVKDIFGLINTIEEGFKAAGEVFSLAVRGLSNTEDVNRMVDGVQSVISAVGSVVSTVGNIVSTVSSIAALAGAAIPGIGQVATVISAITGGIGSFNGIIDLIQEGMGFIGRIFGGFLSGVAGGPDGALYGKITTLVDTNDGTIKTWSDANPADKRERRFGKGNGDNINNRNGGIDTVNLYTGPGVDPQQMIGDMMFAVKAGNAGVYAGV